MNKELLDEIITYIEDCEVQIDGEWGSGGTLSELIRDNVMPELYTKLLALKETPNTQQEMKIKWTQVMEAADKSGFTDKEYGLIYSSSPLDETIGVEEYSIGESIKKLLEALGVEIEIDVTFKGEE